jgi:NADH dehydrogenase
MSTFVITGASGFVGRCLLEFLVNRGERVVAISRKPQPQDVVAPSRWVVSDLLQPDTYQAELESGSSVVHLAAVTGKAPAEEFVRGNVTATRLLLEASQRANVGRFVFVSSIAARFSDRRFYPYADSKISAEEMVRRSLLRTVIVRPTMIFGCGSPVRASLARLAGLPVIPIFGDGSIRVQPIDVTDVVRVLADLAQQSSEVSGIVEIGGPRTYTLEELLLSLRVGNHRSAPVVHIPLEFTRRLLALVEKPLLSVLPFTAGQLASFANDGVARGSNPGPGQGDERLATPSSPALPT